MSEGRCRAGSAALIAGCGGGSSVLVSLFGAGVSGRARSHDRSRQPFAKHAEEPTLWQWVYEVSRTSERDHRREVKYFARIERFCQGLKS